MISGPQRKFIEGIVSGLDQTAAYRAAYPKCSAKMAESAASRLSRNVKVKEEIAKQREALESKAELSREALQRYLERIILAKPSDASPDSDICETVMTKDGPFTALLSKMTAFDRLARMRGLYQPEKVELTGETKITVRIGS